MFSSNPARPPRRIHRRVAIAASTLALAAAGLGLGTTAASAAPGDASIYVVHGIPNTPVDVYVNGTNTLPNFQPGTVAGPLELAPGNYQVTIYAAGTTTNPVIDEAVPVTANLNATLVANLDPANQPQLSVFANDVSPIPSGQARLTVRHTAAAPNVDARANGAVVFANLAPGGQASTPLAPATVSADAVLAGTSTVVIGPAQLPLTAGTSTIVYAIGSAAPAGGGASTLAFVVQNIAGLAAPAAAPAPVAGAAVNTGGEVRAADASSLWIAGGAGALGIALAVAAGVLYRRQRASA